VRGTPRAYADFRSTRNQADLAVVLTPASRERKNKLPPLESSQLSFGISSKMKSILSAAAALGLVSTINGLTLRDKNCGCNKALPTGIKPDESVNLTLSSSSGVSPRKYRLHLPKGYDGSKELPLILSFHGRSRDALFQEELSQFSNASYGFKGISVYPQGVPLVSKVRYAQNDSE
jgi:hypothetical protein